AIPNPMDLGATSHLGPAFRAGTARLRSRLRQCAARTTGGRERRLTSSATGRCSEARVFGTRATHLRIFGNGERTRSCCVVSAMAARTIEVFEGVLLERERQCLPLGHRSVAEVETDFDGVVLPDVAQTELPVYAEPAGFVGTAVELVRSGKTTDAKLAARCWVTVDPLREVQRGGADAPRGSARARVGILSAPRQCRQHQRHDELRATPTLLHPRSLRHSARVH